jgi:hypothetical protein
LIGTGISRNISRYFATHFRHFSMLLRQLIIDALATIARATSAAAMATPAYFAPLMISRLLYFTPSRLMPSYLASLDILRLSNFTRLAAPHRSNISRFWQRH